MTDTRLHNDCDGGACVACAEDEGRTMVIQEGWQPIVTAPKDGTVVDVWVWSLERVSRDSDELRQSAGMRVVDVYYSHDEGWLHGLGVPLCDVLNWFSDCIVVTHWLPAPKEPKGDIQPIETAPKDGTRIYLISPWHQIIVGWWDGANWRYGEKPGENWGYDYATHWMLCAERGGA